MSDPIEFTVQVSEADLVEFYTFEGKKTVLILRVLAFTMAAFIVIGVGLLIRDGGPIASDLVLLCVAGAIVVGAVWLIPWNVRRYSRSQLASSPSLRASATYRIDGEAIAVRTPISEGTMTWEVIVRAIETTTCFGLCMSNISAIIVPKHRLTHEAASELRSLLSSKGLFKAA